MDRRLETNPLVSVIIPVFNRADTIGTAVDSVLQQTYQNIELIVIDDGSSDATPKILEGYRGRIRVVRQKNSGPSVARNRGIKISTGQIIAFLDSDDIWLPEKLERQVSILLRCDKSVSCCLCNALLFEDGVEKESFDEANLYPAYEEGLWQNVTKVLSTRFVFFTQAVTVRREAMDMVGLFDENLWVMEDYELAVRLSMIGPWAYTREPLVVYHGGSDYSLTTQAQKNPIRLHECLEILYEKIILSGQTNCPISLRYFNQSLKLAHRNLRVAGMLQKHPFWSLVLMKSFILKDKILNAAFRRSPWFPKMEVVPL